MGVPGTNSADEQPSFLGAAQHNRALAASLAAPLHEACDGCLGPITWFRTDWQRGGAATGFADWTTPDGGQRPVVVKLPVNTRELSWTRRLQTGDGDPPIPVLHASGDGLAGYDIGWIVIERLPHGPLGKHWHDDHVKRIANAAAAFHARAGRHPVDRPIRHENWGDLLHAARDAVKENVVKSRQRWGDVLRTVSQHLDVLVGTWEARQPIEWLHGDLHLANAMSRVSDEDGPVCLIDLAEVRPGHWVEDAIYLERQLWAVPERLRVAKPFRELATARKAHGLDNAPDDGRLANLRRVLLAATAPAFLKSEGHPAYLKACLERLEQVLPQLVR